MVRINLACHQSRKITQETQDESQYVTQGRTTTENEQFLGQFVEFKEKENSSCRSH